MFKASLRRNLNSSRHEGDPGDDPEFKLPKRSSLAIVIAANLMFQLSFYAVVPTSNQYAEYLGGSSTFSGIVIGIPTLFSGLALIPMARLDKGTYKVPLHIACAAGILGHLLYACAYRARFLYLILIGRCINGVAFTFFMYCKRYCADSRIVGIRRRTTLASWQVICQGLGMSLGPFMGGLLYKVGFKNSMFNGYTSLGWVMACMFAVFWVCVTLWFEDVPQETGTVELRSLGPGDPTPSPPAEEKHFDSSEVPVLPPSAVSTRPPSPVSEPLSVQLYRITSAQWGVIICMCWFAMTCFFILGSWESNLPVYGAILPDLHWSPFASGNFIAIGGLACFPFLLANLLFARRIQDRKLLVFGSSLGTVGLFIFLALIRSNAVSYASLFVCWWAVALGFNLATTVTMSLASKQLPPEWNPRISMAIPYSIYLGRMTGAVWGGSGVRVGMLNFIGLDIGLVGIGVVLFASLWRDLKAKTG
ncbi:MFS general substrate transporter [Leucogyrophana mollusca]|uniref:MFS general substrate transporter n=1 Tax=Leucogyrophana mollusca TaxID=85980 RepID=A0ACB8B8Z1_9AGAM|nr:MFS general substrate transporter [Leucogyrophana mollusca]